MASDSTEKTAQVMITERDKWVLSLLQVSPLDSKQICHASQGRQGFTTERKVARRMRLLRDAGAVSIFDWKVNTLPTKKYYVTTSLGRGLVTGNKGRGNIYGEVSIANSEHQYKIGDVTVATVRDAQRLGLALEQHTGDKQFVAKIPGDDKAKPNKPDRRCVLVTPHGQLEFWDEIDMHSETIGGQDCDSLEAKICFHVARRRASPAEDYQVRVFFKKDGSRMQRFLELAKQHAENNECIFIATTYEKYCESDSPLTELVFQDHAGRARRCYKPYRVQAKQPLPQMQQVTEKLAEPVLV